MLNESVEIEIVTWLQRIGGALEIPLTFFTYLGIPIIYIVVVPVLHWTIDSRLATRVAVFLFAGGMINDITKIVFKGPRPFWVSAEVETFGETSGGFGMPSGHSQVAAPAWGLIVAATARRWSLAAGVVVAVLIGVSRIYLGAHSPSQVIIGLGVGAALLWALLRYERPALDRFLAQPLGRQLLLGAGVTAVGVALGYGVVTLSDSWTVPPAWAANFAAASGGAEPLDPVGDHGLAFSAGSLAGTLLGATLQHHTIGWRCTGTVARRLVRLPIGAVAVVVPAAVVSTVFELVGVDTDHGSGAKVFGFALTFSLFFGVFYLAPAAFRRLQPDPTR